MLTTGIVCAKKKQIHSIYYFYLCVKTMGPKPMSIVIRPCILHNIFIILSKIYLDLFTQGRSQAWSEGGGGPKVANVSDGGPTVHQISIRVSWRPVLGGSLPTKNWLLPPPQILSRLYVDNDLQQSAPPPPNVPNSPQKGENLQEALSMLLPGRGGGCPGNQKKPLNTPLLLSMIYVLQLTIYIYYTLFMYSLRPEVYEGRQADPPPPLYQAGSVNILSITCA